MKHQSRKIYFILLLSFICIQIFSPLKTKAQTQIFFETFGNTSPGACDQGTMANGFVSPNGTWTVTSLGINDSAANEWYISAAEPGLAVDSCSKPGCFVNLLSTDRTLHIGNVSNSPNASVLCPTGDCGAVYDPGGFQIAVQTNKRVESPPIIMQGQVSHLLQFNYIETGDGATNNDNMFVEFYDGSSWVPAIADPARTNNCGLNQANWKRYSVLLPVLSTTSNNIKIGFTWFNDNGGIGSNPSIAIDSIIVFEYTLPGSYISVSDSVICMNDCIDFFCDSAGPIAQYNWTFPGSSTPTSFQRNPTSICYTNAGVYLATLVLFIPNGTDTSSITITVDSCPVAIEEPNWDQIKIFPNPASSYLMVTSNENFVSKLELTIYDLTGRMILTKTISSNHDKMIDISTLRNGSYLLKIRNDENQLFNDKIIILK